MSVCVTHMSRREAIVFWIVALFVLLFSAWRFDGPSRGYWDTYISVPAAFMCGEEVNLTRIDGTPRYNYSLIGSIPEDTYDPREGSFGIASQDQRIGTAIQFAAPFSIVNMAAFRWGYAITWVFVFAFAFFAMKRIVGGVVLPFVGAGLLVFNSFSLYLDRLNGNLFGMAILVFMFFLMTERHVPWWLLGLLYGILGGIRNEAIVLGPIFLAFMWRDTRSLSRMASTLAVFAGSALLTILPVLFWNQFAYGQMIIHPSQVAHLEGFRPTFPHTFMGSEFQFNGLLNWPFIDEVVRTPHFAFPTFVTWGLVTVKVFGVLLTAFAIAGLFYLARWEPFMAVVLSAWYLLIFGLFAFQENWEELKQTFLALHLFPIVVFVVAGLKWFSQSFLGWAAWFKVAVLCLVLFFGIQQLGEWRVPADERWYQRFPHAAANESGLDILPEELRKDWHYFYTREVDAEYVREVEHMTEASLLPSMYRPLVTPDNGVWARMAKEPATSTWTTLAIWSYIYE